MCQNCQGGSYSSVLGNQYILCMEAYDIGLKNFYCVRAYLLPSCSSTIFFSLCSSSEAWEAVVIVRSILCDDQGDYCLYLCLCFIHAGAMNSATCSLCQPGAYSTAQGDSRWYPNLFLKEGCYDLWDLSMFFVTSSNFSEMPGIV